MMSVNSPIHTLPQETLYKIFLNLDSPNLRKCSLVCRQWSEQAKVIQAAKEWQAHVELESIALAYQGSERKAKGKRVFSEVQPNDSDDECSSSDSQENIFIFAKTTHAIPVRTMTIPCFGQNIKGSTLIEIVHAKVQDWYGDGVNLCCEYEKDIGGAVIAPPEEKGGVIAIGSPGDWFLSLGGWKGMMPSEEVKDYFMREFDAKNKGKKFIGVEIYQNGLIFPIINGRIHMPPGFSINEIDVTISRKKQGDKWVKICKTDLSYKQIVNAIETIKNGFNLSDSKIAILQLCFLSRGIDLPTWFYQEISNENQIQIQQFLDYLNALMFGVEASGLNAALATGLMLLDLIVHGQLDYKTSFKANNDGGVYPYACVGNNKGTYNEREKILLHNKQNQDSYSMKGVRRNTSLSPVASKEAILIKKWIDYYDVTLKEEDCIPRIVRIKLIEEAVIKLIGCYFSPWFLGEQNFYLKQFKKVKDIN